MPAIDEELQKRIEAWEHGGWDGHAMEPRVLIIDLISALKAAAPVAEAIEMKLSPSDIEVLIHCHCRPCPHPRRDAPAIFDAIRRFLYLGAIEHSPENDCEPDPPDHEEPGWAYRTTPLGAAWINAMCSVPPPRKVFVDEQDRVVGNT